MTYANIVARAIAHTLGFHVPACGGRYCTDPRTSTGRVLGTG